MRHSAMSKYVFFATCVRVCILLEITLAYLSGKQHSKLQKTAHAKKEGKLKKNCLLKISFVFLRIATPNSEFSFWLKNGKAKNKGLFTI